MARSPQDSASTPIAALGLVAISSGLQVATWNAGVDQSNSFASDIQGAMKRVATAIFELAKTCHVIAINELHPKHVELLRAYLVDINLRVEIKSFECHDALVWHPRLVKHLGSEQMQTAPKSLSRYANSRYHVESRFGTLDGEVEWIVAVCHVRSGSKKLGNQVPGATPLKRVEAKRNIVRQAMLASVKTLDGSSKAIGCVLLGDFNLTPAQVLAVLPVSLTPNKLVTAVRGYDDVQGSACWALANPLVSHPVGSLYALCLGVR